MTPKVAYLPDNTRGRDFIVGDLHGCFDELMFLLDQVRFDPACDRLFSTGDLVDRGPRSMDCLRLLRQPWLFAVQGNHERLLLDALADPEGARRMFHRVNGGDWADDLIDTLDGELWSLCDEIAALPHVIVVGKDSRGRFNLVHAHLLASSDPVVLWTDQEIDTQAWPDTGGIIDTLTWARTLAFEAGLAAQTNARPDFYPGLSLTYCGHNPVPCPVTIYSHCFVDTGAGYQGNVWVGDQDSGVPMHLTMLERLPEGGHAVRVAGSSIATGWLA
ncbi:serine/threonine protein phosphatase 1 [Chitinivorax tropicus]|uniref:Serine/threonine protein phosphatase 1 n=1 Tax=Chitinivorax tropicus TaxID=714531 RepID=A0A840MVC3_9PROT|nr:metallophosphoesterase [Chitinivorax tropicus]MBB5020283.1 serine/threonine protein phosphatase 1 [Chitinivorax tropicus]